MIFERPGEKILSGRILTKQNGRWWVDEPVKTLTRRSLLFFIKKRKNTLPPDQSENSEMEETEGNA